MGDGEIEVEGKYEIKKQKLILKIPDDEPTFPTISFRGENLVLGEESWAEFKKVKANSSSPPRLLVGLPLPRIKKVRFAAFLKLPESAIDQFADFSR